MECSPCIPTSRPRDHIVAPLTRAPERSDEPFDLEASPFPISFGLYPISRRRESQNFVESEPSQGLTRGDAAHRGLLREDDGTAVTDQGATF